MLNGYFGLSFTFKKVFFRFFPSSFQGESVTDKTRCRALGRKISCHLATNINQRVQFYFIGKSN